MSASAGFINSQTKDKIDSSTAKNTTINANATYLLPVKSLAFQLWTTMSSTKNDSPSSPLDYNSISFNFETLWMKSKSSKITFGVGVRNKKDKISTANNSNEISFITRYTYSF
jgi:hemolysin activation/secretion protein